ncbi:ISAs1 family transposase [Bernardetia litoralis]|uniref:ISAs1 family transposase n=1 Tax=Bernardetia litoralis TaxID=999 RepID=UPI0009D9D6D7|nr:ISAs1 family transposase [Bernardetia litoralis]
MFDKTVDFGSGQIEIRSAYVVENIKLIDQLAEWQTVKSIIVIESKREKNDSLQENTRFYLCSFVPTQKQVNQYVRAHWGIEGTLHWHLDVSFGEDKSKTKKGNAPENLNIIRKTALQALKQTEGKQSIKNKRKMTG